MKPSNIITSALILNTTILFGQGFDIISNSFPIWAMSALETTLIIAFIVNRIFRVYSKAFEIDYGNLNVFVQGSSSIKGQASLFEVKKMEQDMNEIIVNESLLKDSLVQFA